MQATWRCWLRSLRLVSTSRAGARRPNRFAGRPPHLEELEARLTPTAPGVVAINRTLPAGTLTNAAAVAYTVTFDQPVTSVDPSDFTLARSGTVAATLLQVSPVAGSNGASYTVTVSGITGDGSLGLNLVDDDSIHNAMNQPLGGVGTGNGNFTGQSYTLDHTDPFVLSLDRSDPATPSTDAASVQFTAAFSEPVTGVDTGEFQPLTTGTVTGSVTQVAPVAGSGGASYTVTVSGIRGDGSLGLNLVDDGTIHDLAGNPLIQAHAPLSFAHANIIPQDPAPDSVTLADLNGDGKADLITAQGNSTPGTVSVLLGNGDGTFQIQTQHTFAVGAVPAGVAVADVNGDGLPDLVVANSFDNTVSVLLGNGDGTFRPQHTLAVGGLPTSVAVADVNGDGLPDLVVANSFDDAVGVLLGNGDGTFQPQQTFATGSDPNPVVVADLNGDSKPDLVVSNGHDNTVSVLLGNGDGTFQPQSTFAVGNVPFALTVADVNGDGNLDLVTANADQTVDVLLGNGDGTFQPQHTIAVGFHPVSLAVIDVNGDGKPDLIVANGNPDSGVASVLLGNGDGTFQPQQTFAVGKYPASAAVADVNGDGKPDLVVANGSSIILGSTATNGSVSVLLANGRGDFTGQVYAIGEMPTMATLTSSAPDLTNSVPIPVSVTFDREVAGFSATGLVVGNGTVSNFTGAGTSYSFDVTPLGPGLVTVDVPAGVARDVVGRPNSAAVQLRRTFVPATWVPAGPAPIVDAPFVEGLKTPGQAGGPVVGAINAIAADPSNPDRVFVATVDGGIWRTSNATAAQPTWTPLTDFLPSLAVGSIAFSPTDPNVLYAGTGNFSSGRNIGGPAGAGVLKSTDGGNTWTLLASSTFAGNPIDSIVPTTLTSSSGGQVVLAADPQGILSSGNGGQTWTLVLSGGQGVLAADPGDPQRFYAGIAGNGIFRSDDGGQSWNPVNTGLSGLAGSLRFLLAVHNNAANGSNAVYAAVIGSTGTLSGVYRSADHGDQWTALDLPSTTENQGNSPQFVGLFPTGAGYLFGSLAADPVDPNVVYIGGEGAGRPSLGFKGEVGNLFRGDASQPSGSQWTALEGTDASGTAPHPDARGLVFDAAGNLLESDDGGLYRLVDPGLPGRHWVSVEGNLQDTEFYSVGYDSLAHVAGGGAQDQGSALQSTPGGTRWTEVVAGDGGTVAVDRSSLPGLTLIYGGAQNLNPLLRGTFDATGTPVGRAHVVSLTGYDPNDRQFITPFVLNAVDPSRILLGGNNHIYESFDRGDDVNAVAAVGTLDSRPESLAYGGWLGSIPNPDVAYVASLSGLFVRTGPAPDPFVQSTSYPGGPPRAVALDPEDWRHAYVIDRSHLYVTTDAGQSWMDISGNLTQLDTLLAGAAGPDLRSLVVLNPSPGTVEILVGGLGGVYQATDPGPNTAWTYLGTNLPHAPVQSLVYNARDNVVVVGTFGRGLWLAPAIPLTLTGLSATSVGQGSPDLLLTVSGTGFAATSAVTWNGVALPTAYVSGTELQALLPAADLAAAGTAALGVARSLPLAEVSNTLTFTVTAAREVFPLVVQAPSAQLLGGTLVLDLSSGHNVLALFRHSHHRVLVLLNGHLRGLFRADTLVLFGGLGNNIIVVGQGLRLPLFLSSGPGSNFLLDSHGLHVVGGDQAVVVLEGACGTRIH